MPTSFDSLPVLNPQNATFYYFIGERGESDIDELWELFASALAYAQEPTTDRREKVAHYFDLAINKKVTEIARLQWPYTGFHRIHF